MRGPPVSKKRRRQAAAEDLEKRQLAAKAKRKKAAEKSRSALNTPALQTQPLLQVVTWFLSERCNAFLAVLQRATHAHGPQ